MDAQVVWLPARPAAERVPPDAAVVTVTPVFGFNPNPRAKRLDRAFTVTDPAKVARIVAVVNGLTRFPDGAFSCPAEFVASEPDDPGRPLACRGSAVSVHIFSMPQRRRPASGSNATVG